MFRTNYIKEKLQSGQSVIGTWCTIPSVALVDVVCASGLDFIIIDSEHGPINFETAQEIVSVCESRNVSPMMRLGCTNESDILRALDIGTHGIQVPNINDKEKANQVVKYAKYPPIGNRGFSPFTKSGEYSFKKAQDLTEKSNLNTLISVHIEDQDAINNIEKILTVKEIDILFIGLFDISKALGIPGQVDSPLVQKKLLELTKKINGAGKYCGTIATSLQSLKEYKRMGIQYITYLVDCNVIKNAFGIAVQTFNESLK